MSRHDRRRGFALFLSLLLLLVLTISAVALMFNTSVEDTLAGVETKVSKTFYAADSGIEYAGAALQGSNSGTNTGSGRNYVGGTVPNGLSSNYGSAQDITVAVSTPVPVGSILRKGSQFATGGSSGYSATPQIVEKVFALNSTATSSTLQSSKTITAEIGIFPWVEGL